MLNGETAVREQSSQNKTKNEQNLIKESLETRHTKLSWFDIEPKQSEDNKKTKAACRTKTDRSYNNNVQIQNRKLITCLMSMFLLNLFYTEAKGASLPTEEHQTVLVVMGSVYLIIIIYFYNKNKKITFVIV